MVDDTREPKTKITAGVDAISLNAFQKKMLRILQLIDALNEELEGFVLLTEEQRQNSEGRFREGESQVLRAILDIAERRPQLFAPLADRDQGNQPGLFETGLLRDRLIKRDAIAKAATKVDEAAMTLKDTVLYLGELTKPVLLAGYRIAKPVAEYDGQLRGWLAPIVAFYSNPVRRKVPGGIDE